MALISKQALIYLYDSFIKESISDDLPIQTHITDDQIERIHNLMLSAENSFFGLKPNKNIIEKVSFIINALNKNHILIDGNKRFSLLMAYYLLDTHGIDPKKISKKDWEMLIMRIATDREYTQKETFEFLTEKLKKTL